MKKIISLLAAIFMVISITACGSSKSAIVGQWKNGSFKMEFFSDGTYTSTDSNHFGSYSIDGDRIRLEGVLVEDWTYDFKIKGDTLTFYYDNGGSLELTKEK